MSPGSGGVVAAGHAVSAEAAAEVLRAGGNAYDAIVAGAWTACIAEPALASPGGGGFLLARPAAGPSRLYDFFVQTPCERRDERELDFRPVEADFGTTRQTFHVGLGSIATPGFVRGLFAIQRDLGTMSMRETGRQAVDLARGGVPVTWFQSYVFRIIAPIMTGDERVRAVFCGPGPEAGTLAEGDLLRIGELADMLETLMIEGEDLFYRGEIARTIAEECAGGGGHLTLRDLESYDVALREPLDVRYRGIRVLTNPPPASGGILAAFGLALLEPLDVPAMRFGSHEHLAAVASAARLTNKARVEAHAEGSPGLDTQRLLDPGLIERYRQEILGRASGSRGTTHLGVIDGAGNVASMTITNGEGCGRMVPGAGFMLNNMLGEEDLNPLGFHRFPLDERMTSMMSPTVVEWPGGRVTATGSGGSNRIRTTILQLLVNLIDHGLSVEQAVAAPRLFVEGDLLSIEAGFDERVVERMCREYPNHQRWDEQNMFFGGAHTVELGPEGFHGAGDPRRQGACIVV